MGPVLTAEAWAMFSPHSFPEATKACRSYAIKRLNIGKSGSGSIETVKNLSEESTQG